MFDQRLHCPDWRGGSLGQNESFRSARHNGLRFLLAQWKHADRHFHSRRREADQYFCTYWLDCYDSRGYDRVSHQNEDQGLIRPWATDYNYGNSVFRDVDHVDLADFWFHYRLALTSRIYHKTA